MAFEPQDLRPYWQDLPRIHPYRIEMEKWERPYRFEEFPRLMYRARKRPDGVVAVIENDDRRCTEPGTPAQPGAAEQWSRGNYMEVADQREYQKALETGYRPTPQAALDFFHQREQSIADEAAHRNFLDRNLSPAAKAEAEAFEGDGSEHVPEIPEAPKRKPGRPKKIDQAA